MYANKSTKHAQELADLRNVLNETRQQCREQEKLVKSLRDMERARRENEDKDEKERRERSRQILAKSREAQQKLLADVGALFKLDKENGIDGEIDVENKQMRGGGGFGGGAGAFGGGGGGGFAFGGGVGSLLMGGGAGGGFQGSSQNLVGSAKALAKAGASVIGGKLRPEPVEWRKWSLYGGIRELDQAISDCASRREREVDAKRERNSTLLSRLDESLFDDSSPRDTRGGSHDASFDSSCYDLPQHLLDLVNKNAPAPAASPSGAAGAADLGGESQSQSNVLKSVGTVGAESASAALEVSIVGAAVGTEEDAGLTSSSAEVLDAEQNPTVPAPDPVVEQVPVDPLASVDGSAFRENQAGLLGEHAFGSSERVREQGGAVAGAHPLHVMREAQAIELSANQRLHNQNVFHNIDEMLDRV